MDLITGVTGFIGKKLAGELSKREKIRVLVRNTNYGNEKVDIAVGDLLNRRSLEKATQKIDTVYHLAGLVGGDEISYKNFEEINVIGTKNLIDACVKNNVKRFVLVSSVAVMGKAINGDESTICKPDTNYGKSKLMAERLVKSYSKKIEIVIIRPTFVYGPGQKNERSTAQLFNKILKQQFVIFGDGENLINFVYIDDVVEGIIYAGKSAESVNQTYILNDEKPTTLNELSDIIAEAGNVEKPRHIPLFIGYPAGLFFSIIHKITGIKVPLTLKRFRNMITNRSFRIDKAKKELRWKPKTSLREGIRRTLSLKQ